MLPLSCQFCMSICAPDVCCSKPDTSEVEACATYQGLVEIIAVLDLLSRAVQAWLSQVLRTLGYTCRVLVSPSMLSPAM